MGHERLAGCRANHASRERPSHRRQFLSTAAALAAAASFPPIGKARSTSRLRLGVIGTGMRGQVLLEELVRRDDVEVAALCDIEKFMLDRALKEVAEAGKPAPRIFTGSDQAWRDRKSTRLNSSH